MIDKVRVVNDFGVDVVLALGKVSDGIKIKNITGLGPVKATLNTTTRANGYGVHYNSKHIGSRNIVLSLGMVKSGAKSVEQIRHDLYRYFPTGEVIELQFESAGKAYNTYGRVESVEPEIFTKDPSMQVSVICFDAHMLELPGNYKVQMSSTTPTQIIYPGRVGTGFRALFTVTASQLPAGLIGQIELIQDSYSTTDSSRRFQIHDFDLQSITGSRLQPGDQVEVVTIPGRKSAKLIRGSEVFNIMGALKTIGGFYLVDNQWPWLFVGKTSVFDYNSTSYAKADIKVEIFWDVLIDGL